MHKISWLSRRIWFALLLMVITASPAFAHDGPKGSEWAMADWMFLSFMLFAGSAFVVFLLVLKAGLLSNLEDAKLYVLHVDEEDYYTPDWAREGGDS